ncbi:heme biosynthesis protein HemY [Rhodovibrionaceae bacterium A322]
MWKGLFFFLKLAILVALGIWLADNPGHATIDWLGYRVESSVAILLVALALLTALMALLYRGYRAVITAPGAFGKVRGDNRRSRGYQALNQGMVALASGDAREAEKWAKKANSLLQDPPLTRLLSAQAAQLNGDEAAAKQHYLDMLEEEETRFLGLRGLVLQARREGDDETAHRYLLEAKALRPTSEWVITSLFEMSEMTGDLNEAETALATAQRQKFLPKAELERKRAVVLLQRAQKARQEDQLADALRDAKQANKLAPDLVPAARLLADLFLANNQPRKAARLLERSWALTPHSDLASAYLEIYRQEEPLKQYKLLSTLVAADANHPEAHLALARAALAAQLWGECRRHLESLSEADMDQRAYRLYAQLEETEKQDTQASHRWLQRGEDAPAAPGWVCDSCGTVSESWTGHCGACQAFDSLNWRRPRRLNGTLAVLKEEEAAPEIIDAEVQETLQDGPQKATPERATAAP